MGALEILFIIIIIIYWLYVPYVRVIFNTGSIEMLSY